MNDQNKSKEQLVAELAELRRRVAELEEARSGANEASSHLAPGDPQWYSLVANTPVFVLILDRDHRIRFANRTLSGDSSDALIGKRLYDFSPTEHHETVRECLDRVLRQNARRGMFE
jgi:PAS domain-containing protein